jgi:hypothetical protein
MFKLEITLVTKVIPRFGHFDTHDILDSNTEFPIGIVAWFVRDDMPSLQSCVVVVWLWPDPLWSLVDVEE